MGDALIHPTLLHPRTGEPLEALGVVGDKIIWPILGGDGREDDANDDDQNDDPDDNDDADDSDEGDNEDDGDDDGDDSEDDNDLGEKGQKALDRMKAERKELRKTIRELKAQVAELRKGDDDEDEDELESARNETKAEREKRHKAEKRLAASKAGLPESWADRLQGDDYEDFLEDAETLAEDLPTPQNRKGGGGAKEGQRKRRKPTLDDRIAEAEKNGDHKVARQLKAQKVHALANQQG